VPLSLPKHPLIAQALGRLRDRRTPTALFRTSLEELGLLLAYEATRGFATTSAPIETPVAPTMAESIATAPLLVPILRAGLTMVPGFIKLFPDASVHHLGLYRDPATLQPVSYYANLPEAPGDTPVFILDPMLATGNSAAAAIETLERVGARNLHLIAILAAPEGVKALEQRFPRLQITSAALDDGLNDHGYIVPGLGDAGDRAFGTLRSVPTTDAFSDRA
jgi:uracil phosphoribosyltransferase